MPVCYSNTYNFLIYRRNTNAKTAGTPNPNKINMLGNWLVFDQYTGNVWADSYESATVNHAYLLSGHGFVNSNNLSSSDSFTFAGDAVFAESFNGNTAPEGAYNIPLGGFSSAFGLGTYTRHVGEMSIGVGNINGYEFYNTYSDEYPNYNVSYGMLFSIGNSDYTNNNGLIRYGESLSNARSNIFSVTQKYVVISGSAYIGYTWKNHGGTNQSYVIDTNSVPIWSDLHVNGGIYASGKLNVNALVSNNLRLNGDSKALTMANKYVPEQMLRDTGVYSSGAKYYTYVTRSTADRYISNLDCNYTINWIDYYESAFRDSICTFKAIITGMISGKCFNLSNEKEYNDCITHLEGLGVFETGYTIIIYDCYPIFSKTSAWGTNCFFIYVKLSIGTGPENRTEDIFYLRPDRRAYNILACFGGDVERWFTPHKEYPNSKTFNCRWSPITQYQDTDSNSDSGHISLSPRTNNQIYFCVNDGEYYIKYYTGELKKINLFADSSTNTINTSLT